MGVVKSITMNIDEEIFLVAREAITLNKAEVLEDRPEYTLIRDKEAGVCYICTNDASLDVYPFIQDALTKENTVAVIFPFEMDLKDVKGVSKHYKVSQYSYRGPRFEVDSPFSILPMAKGDLGYLQSHYIRIGDDEFYLLDAISRGMLKAVDSNGDIMGFIGEHPEHALGMLYVDENHRRKGVGTALEKAMINKFIDEGKVPFDHVVVGNYKSDNLQRSLGMSLDRGCIHWYF